MLGQRIFGRKKKQRSHKKIVADEERQHSSHHTSSNVQDVPAAIVSGKPAVAWEDKQQTKKTTTWGNRLFGYLDKKESVPERRPPATQTASQEDNRKSWWSWLLNRRGHRVSPLNTPEEQKTDSPNPERRREISSSSSSPAKINKRDEQDKRGHQPKVTPSCFLDDVIQADSVDFINLVEKLLMTQVNFTKTNKIWDILLNGPVDPFGFPNIGQSCYMNSSLQSLLTLEDFIGDISRTEQVWSSVPEAQLMRSLLDIRNVHSSTDAQVKIPLLRSFKEVVSAQAPEFRDPLQKDAHEFLTAVLEQMRSLAPVLKQTAALMGRSYTCPVERHMVITTENTRTCKSCGAQSKRKERFTNLSLDLVPGGSVEDMLQGYLKDREVEFRCGCGGKTSSCRSSFVHLPRVLILQLKRFRFSPLFQLEKADNPVRLMRDLVISSKKGGSCYSLISAISHFGSTETGHYISEGIHPDNNLDKPGDRWLTFDDSTVFETSGEFVCEQQKRGAYILFYKRMV